MTIDVNELKAAYDEVVTNLTLENVDDVLGDTQYFVAVDGDSRQSHGLYLASVDVKLSETIIARVNYALADGIAAVRFFNGKKWVGLSVRDGGLEERIRSLLEGQMMVKKSDKAQKATFWRVVELPEETRPFAEVVKEVSMIHGDEAWGDVFARLKWWREERMAKYAPLIEPEEEPEEEDDFEDEDEDVDQND